MGRRSSYSGSASLSPFALLANLKTEEAFRFAIQFQRGQTFVGASPERLYRRDGRKVVTEALAGTRKRGVAPEEDLFLENELRESDKEKREFAFVKESIEKSLESLCSSLSCCTEEYSVIKTPNVQHLFAPYEGVLQDGVDDQRLLLALSPTAAMGGIPKKAALETMARKEPFERGWFAAPIGYVSSDEAEFAVSIRSALIEEKTLHLFAAAGIVEGSHPEKEWDELEHKTALWKKGLQWI